MPVKLVACQTGTKQFVGGFKLEKGATGKSKAGYYAVPSGSVYFFELADQTEKQTIDNLVRKQMFGTIANQVNDMAQQGFGTTLIGGY